MTNNLKVGIALSREADNSGYRSHFTPLSTSVGVVDVSRLRFAGFELPNSNLEQREEPPTESSPLFQCSALSSESDMDLHIRSRALKWLEKRHGSLPRTREKLERSLIPVCSVNKTLSPLALHSTLVRLGLKECTECYQICSFGDLAVPVARTLYATSEKSDEEKAIELVNNFVVKAGRAGKLPTSMKALRNQISSIAVRHRTNPADVVSWMAKEGKIQISGGDETITYSM